VPRALGGGLSHRVRARLATRNYIASQIVTVVPTGQPLTGDTAITRLREQLERASSAALSPNGTRVVTVNDKTARVWDAATGKSLTRPLEHQRWVVSAAFSPDGTRVVTASDDKTARVWDAATGERGDRQAAHAPPRASAQGGERRVQPRRHPRGYRER
jgi:WD40 repeat protein